METEIRVRVTTLGGAPEARHFSVPVFRRDAAASGACSTRGELRGRTRRERLADTRKQRMHWRCQFCAGVRVMTLPLTADSMPQGQLFSINSQSHPCSNRSCPTPVHHQLLFCSFLYIWCIGVDGGMAEQLISTAVHDKLPESYVRAETERPRLGEVVADAHIPVVDLADPDSATVVAQIGAACRSHGFFQVLNHGLPVELMLAAMAVAHEFFRLSPEEKAKLYSDDPAKKMRLSTSFNVRKETVHNWRDYLRLHCHPLEQFVPDWPANPLPFREIMSTYCKEVRELGFRLYAAISESLGLEEDYIKKVLGEQEQHMAVNFYPKCPEPELTYGLPAHTDPNALTILLMDQQVAGLQVLKEGKWIAVNPRPNALVINLGDQLQALSNGRYKSVWHRAVVNSDRARMSIASFLCPCNNVLLGPAEKLIGEGSPAVYRNYTYDEYYKKFWSRNLDQEHCLELFRT